MYQGTLREIVWGMLREGRDTMDCETALVGSRTELRQTSTWGE